ncbi:MAG: cysteine synthase A [Epsilonproteobacteria bacterium]|nr:cysteine synthase A [Campylobacterota bacterium]NPA56757.1 cysteine synthase A [Campylobacterota bacterium]
MVATAVTDLIGGTPLVQIDEGIFGKCEFLNPGGSIKDRIALNMVREALERGEISRETPLVEATSGNTGIGLAMVAASLGMEVVLVMPESMSLERRKLLKFLGARLILTPAEEGMEGAVRKAEELRREGYFMLDQFRNRANPEAHRATAQEIVEAVPDLEIFVAGVGTGGTITGVGKFLKPRGVRIFAVEPARSPVLSGGAPGPHGIQGIGAGFVPPLLDTTLFQEVIPIDDGEALATARQLGREKGLLVGISSGANVAAARRLAERYPGRKIVTVLPDGVERYLSTELVE